MATQAPSPPKKITLEEISQRKQTLLTEIRAQKTTMTHLVQEIVAPIAPATSKTNALMRSFHTGMAIFDGVMMGVKIMRKIRTYFRKLN